MRQGLHVSVFFFSVISILNYVYNAVKSRYTCQYFLD
uniref:Uncharacterized protein n=1 Tax=Anguilla anguilla TaxID=7936 RepID=A0A0E9S760_ANGAN